MYGLPKDFDFSIFRGRVLEGVSFYQAIMHFTFEDGPVVGVEWSLGYKLRASDELTVVEIPLAHSDLMQLLGKTVRKAYAEDAGTLVLEFEDGAELKFFDCGPQYEAYQIRYNGMETIV